ncbi:MAG: glucose-1-phosphate thymidylyltransferase [bacterium]|nr:glucose-1-phosphate thymidylyltransferase [bacterium]
MAMKPVLFLEVDLPELLPFSRFRSIFSFRDGIYSSFERARLTYPDREFVYFHADPERERLLAGVEGLDSYRSLADRYGWPSVDTIEEKFGENLDQIFDLHSPRRFPAINGFIDVLTPANVPVLDLLNRIPKRLTADLEWWLNVEANRLMRRKDLRNGGVQIVGDPLQLFVHESARVLPGSIFDTSNGPIVIDQGAKISPFSYLEGPLYVGPNARIDDARLTGGCILGAQVRAGGEIENSIFDAFSNKHHEGFVGHSVLGRWVNLGALSTTSDLKNNYGPVRLQIDGHPVDTHTIKFGSLIGDCVKTAIGTMLNTGTVLDAGSNVFGGSPAKYLPPLSWGLAGNRYEAQRFVSDCEKIFARRDQKPPEQLGDLVRLCS